MEAKPGPSTGTGVRLKRRWVISEEQYECSSRLGRPKIRVKTNERTNSGQAKYVRQEIDLPKGECYIHLNRLLVLPHQARVRYMLSICRRNLLASGKNDVLQ